jgi:hypothetical protein
LSEIFCASICPILSLSGDTLGSDYPGKKEKDLEVAMRSNKEKQGQVTSACIAWRVQSWAGMNLQSMALGSMAWLTAVSPGLLQKSISARMHV